MTRLRIIEPPDEIHINRNEPPAGSMWRFPDMDFEGHEAWCIVLPNGAGLWYTTQQSGFDGPRWGVTGEPPNITVTPSINAGDDFWHGWITNGEMTP